MIAIKLTTEQKISVRIEPKTAAGNPAQIDGKPRWEQLSGLATVELDEDGLGATLISQDKIEEGDNGESQFRVEFDADLGEGVETVAEVLTLFVESAKATQVGVSLGEPQIK